MINMNLTFFKVCFFYPLRGVSYTAEMISYSNISVTFGKNQKSSQGTSKRNRRTNLMQKTNTQKSLDSVPLKGAPYVCSYIVKRVCVLSTDKSSWSILITDLAIEQIYVFVSRYQVYTWPLKKCTVFIILSWKERKQMLILFIQ